MKKTLLVQICRPSRRAIMFMGLCCVLASPFACAQDNETFGGGTLYVNASQPDDSGNGLSWPTAKRTIQGAVDVANGGDTVWVTNGVYNVGGATTPGYTLPSRVVITKQVVVRSVNGADYTIIQGPGTNTYGTASAMRCVYMTDGVLDGFTLQGGATLQSSSPDGQGAGAFATSATPEIRHCLITGNSGYFGGGVYRGTLNNCRLTGNRASSLGGGALSTALNNCLLTGNMASSGGGVFGGTLNNCLLIRNVAVNDGGGACWSFVYNSIVWGNTKSSGATNDCYVLGAYNSCASDISPTDGCINVPPLFVDEANGNFRLRPNSPCVDKGNNAYAPNLPDMDGNTRIADGDTNGVATVDMGIFEFGAIPGASIPVFMPSGYTSFVGTLPVSISCATVGASIYYTLDGSEPTTNRLFYTNAFPVTVTTTVKARAFKADMPDSVTVTATFLQQPVATPVLSPESMTTFDSSLSVTVTCATAGAEIHYTLDGSDPTTISPLYSIPLSLTVTTTVKARAFKAGMSDSLIVAATFTQQTVATPILSPDSLTTFTNSLEVAVTCATAGAEIRYTLDNTTPTEASPLYTGAITITSNTTVCVKAFKQGMIDSATSSATYTREYVLRVIGGSGGGGYAPGAAVMVAFDAPPVGQVFGGWSVSPGGTSLGTAFDTRETMTSLVMPAAHVTLSAIYRAPVTIYADASRPNDSGDGFSWATAKRTLQAAVYAAGEGGYYASDVILATNGVYNAGGSAAPGYSLNNRLVIAREVVVRSVNGAAVTVIEGSGANNFDTANSMRCVFLSKGVLEGFTLRKGSTWKTSDMNSLGGGVYMTSRDLVVRNCVIAANRAQDGGGAYYGTLNNCLLTENSAATSGGGASGSTLNNCTVAGNTAGVYAGGISNITDLSRPYNCIIWSNLLESGATDDCSHTQSFYVYNTCALGLTAENGNISVNPLFVDAAAGNYRLQTNSPCIDRGSNTYAPNLPDLDGNARMVDGDTNGTATVDMGAYEFGSRLAASAPIFTPGHGTSFTGMLAVLITCATADAEIRYTVDGTDPTTNSFLYATSLSLDATTTVKARAYRTGMPESVMVTATFIKQTVATPVFFPGSGTSFTGTLSVAISCATVGAEIRYTLDGLTPSALSPLYTGPLAISVSTTVCAKAFKLGMYNSPAEISSYSRQQVATPVIVPGSGLVFIGSNLITVLCATGDAEIRYTLDGTPPTLSSTLYTGPFSLFATATVRVKAFKAGMTDSAVVFQTVTQQSAETPIISPPSTTAFTSNLVVSVSCATPGATIRYTTDGNDPTGSSALYTGAFTLSASTTVKARAYLTRACPKRFLSMFFPSPGLKISA